MKRRRKGAESPLSDACGPQKPGPAIPCGVRVMKFAQVKVNCAGNVDFYHKNKPFPVLSSGQESRVQTLVCARGWEWGWGAAALPLVL